MYEFATSRQASPASVRLVYWHTTSPWCLELFNAPDTKPSGVLCYVVMREIFGPWNRLYVSYRCRAIAQSLKTTASTEMQAADRFVSLIALRHKVVTFEFHMYSIRIYDLYYAIQPTFKTNYTGGLPWDHSPSGLSRIDEYSETNLLSWFLANSQC